MTRPKAEKLFATEAAMCAHFIDHLPTDWTPYPETQGWDILLVRDVDGFQIGIQAKLKLGTEVINQAIEDWYSITRNGPDCRAILVPENSKDGFERICSHIGLTIIRVEREAKRWHKRMFEPDLPTIKDLDRHWHEEWFELAPMARHPLPKYVPDVPAGASAPLQLTQWKIAAMKIAITLERRGFVTREDFKFFDIDHRRWIGWENSWLLVQDGRFVAGPRLPDFKTQHPRVYQEIAADFDKWKSPERPQLFTDKAGEVALL